MNYKSFAFLAALLIIVPTAAAHDIYVSTRGNDRNVGTKTEPKATLAAALREAREYRRLYATTSVKKHNLDATALSTTPIPGGITIHMEEGSYNIYEPIFIRPEDSGTSESPTVILG